jgi:hypothetical protein
MDNCSDCESELICAVVGSSGELGGAEDVTKVISDWEYWMGDDSLNQLSWYRRTFDRPVVRFDVLGESMALVNVGQGTIGHFRRKIKATCTVVGKDS